MRVSVSVNTASWADFPSCQVQPMPCPSPLVAFVVRETQLFHNVPGGSYNPPAAEETEAQGGASLGPKSRSEWFLGSKALLSPLCLAVPRNNPHMPWSSGRPYSRTFHTPLFPMIVGGWTPGWASFEGRQPAVLDRVLWPQRQRLLGLLPAMPPLSLRPSASRCPHPGLSLRLCIRWWGGRGFAWWHLFLCPGP